MCVVRRTSDEFYAKQEEFFITKRDCDVLQDKISYNGSENSLRYISKDVGRGGGTFNNRKTVI
jgi:hypothetical protein